MERHSDRLIPRPSGFDVQKRHEKARQRVVVDGRSGIFDAHRDGLRVGGGPDAHHPLFPRQRHHRVEGVAHDAQEHLLDLDLVGQRLREAGDEIEGQADAPFRGLVLKEAGGAPDRLVEVQPAFHGLAAADENAHPLDDLRRSKRLARHVFDRVLKLRIGLGPFPVGPQQGLGTGKNGGEGLAQLVRPAWRPSRWP